MARESVRRRIRGWSHGTGFNFARESMKISIALTSGQLSGELGVTGEKREPSEIPRRTNEIVERMGKERKGREHDGAHNGTPSVDIDVVVVVIVVVVVVVVVVEHTVYVLVRSFRPTTLASHLPTSPISNPLPPRPYGNALKLTLVFQSQTRRLHDGISIAPRMNRIERRWTSLFTRFRVTVSFVSTLDLVILYDRLPPFAFSSIL